MPTPENPVLIEHPEEVKIPENLQNEIQAIETNAKVSVQVNNHGQPVISPSQSATIQVPTGNQATLIAQAKGSVNNAMTWLAMFLLRIFAKKELRGVKVNNADNDE